MNWKKLRQQVRFGWQFVPFTLNAILLALALYWCYQELKVEQIKTDVPSSFAPFLILMGKTALWFLMAMLIFCLCSVLFCYLRFLWLKKTKNTSVQLEFSQSEKRTKIGFKAILQSVWRPWLGSIRFRLLYDDGRMTAKFPLLENQREKGHFFRKSIFGKQALVLPDIKEYELKGSFIYFEDLLHLFSCSFFIPQKGHFFQAPNAIRQEVLAADPQQMQEKRISVQESKRMPGDFVNYKDFEGGDDIRRIVWQVYAKNKELVVRVPEERDYYASHLNFYASFFQDLDIVQGQRDFTNEMLNFYKNCIWTAIEALLKKDLPLSYIPDQALISEDSGTQTEQIQRKISHATWQKDKFLLDYFPKEKQGILCLSSFNSVSEVKAVLEQAGKETIIYFVPLSYAFHHFVAWGWLKRIFIKAPVNRLKRIRSRWPFSPLRYQLKKREKELIKTLENFDIQWAILK